MSAEPNLSLSLSLSLQMTGSTIAACCSVHAIELYLKCCGECVQSDFLVVKAYVEVSKKAKLQLKVILLHAVCIAPFLVG